MKNISIYGDSCYKVCIKSKIDSKVPLSKVSKYYWDMRMANSTEKCIWLLFTGSSLSDYVRELECVFGQVAYIHSVNYYSEITVCKNAAL